MKKLLAISTLIFASLIGSVAAYADSILNVKEHLETIQKNAEREKVRQEKYEKAIKAMHPKKHEKPTKNGG